MLCFYSPEKMVSIKTFMDFWLKTEQLIVGILYLDNGFCIFNPSGIETVANFYGYSFGF